MTLFMHALAGCACCKPSNATLCSCDTALGVNLSCNAKTELNHGACFSDQNRGKVITMVTPWSGQTSQII